MLFKCSRYACYVPARFVGVSGIMCSIFVGPVVYLQGRVGTRSMLVALLSAVCLYVALAQCRVLSMKGEALWVRGLHRRRSLELGACVFGVRPERTGPRGSWVYVVFVTDSVVSEPFGQWSRESAARSTVSRLNALVGPQAMNPRRELASRQVAQLEHEWKTKFSLRDQWWAAYYKSKSWRTAKYVTISVALLCFLALWLFLYLTQR